MEDKRFDDWKEVSCNECANYYTNACDGVTKGARKPCNSFIATRSVVIPKQIERLYKRIWWLTWANVVSYVVLLMLLLGHLFE